MKLEKEGKTILSTGFEAEGKVAVFILKILANANIQPNETSKTKKQTKMETSSEIMITFIFFGLSIFSLFEAHFNRMQCHLFP